MADANLTTYQEKILRLRDEDGLQWKEVALHCGKSIGAVSGSYYEAKRKMEEADFGGSAPVQTAGVLDEMTESFPDLEKAAEACGMSKRLLNALMLRLKRRYGPVVAGVARFKDKEMVDALRRKAVLAMEYMDDVSASKASFKDLAMAAGMMVDKAQLLEGKPTQITGNEERKKLDELLPRLVEEAGRRGITLEGEKVPRLIEEARRRGIPIEGLKTTYTVEKNDSEKKGE